MPPSNDVLLRMYALMVRSRAFENAIKAAYLEGKTPLFNMANGPIPGEMHLSSGQEPCAVGVCAHLGAEDFVTATHRAHHVAIAKGVDLEAMTGEIFGKASGLAGGRGGHMHLLDPAVNFSCSGIVAQGLGPAIGAALAFKLRGESHVGVAFIGEGACNQGAFHECLNLAATWRLPFVCIVEDNAYAISVPKHSSTAIARNEARAAAYGMPGHFVSGNDPLAVYDIAGEAITHARAGLGPSLIEIETDRLEGHFMGDAEAYRPAGEKDALLRRDPLPKLRGVLLDAGVLTEAQAEELEGAEADLVAQAIAKARAAPEPPATFATSAVFVERGAT